MNVLLISECSKRALTETRRILDQFAERRGERTWQTPITQQGLATLRRMLRKTARRNTAVACHWIRGKDHSELLWIVGDASRFNAQGAVPTNTTARDVLRSQDENDWHTAEDIRLLAALAALFHDFGKACQAFQAKLRSPKPLADAYRHEWVSLRLFQAFIGTDDDEQWLRRLAGLANGGKVDTVWLKRLIKDGIADNAPSPFKGMPSLAKAVGWLIVSHHRLPAQMARGKSVFPQALRVLPTGIGPEWNGARTDAGRKEIGDCWSFKQGTPFDSADWCRHAARLAQRMLDRPGLLKTDWWQDPYVMHLSRLVLMLADHYYSSEPSHKGFGDANYALYANTDRETRALKQRLDEHLIGVAAHSGRIARVLPALADTLPRIARHKGFKRRSADKRFQWQDKAYDLAVGLQAKSQAQGFFGINMASTGCGKTLANGRILYGLADPRRGARFSIALGLRTLTLQTGQAYRERLGLGEDDLAVLVGGGGVKTLFERAQTKPSPAIGSESAEALLEDNTHVHFEGSLEDGPLKRWLDKSPDAQRLLAAPVLTCTIDHLIPATEGVRGGRQIAPMLRLLTADLVLDEPDDFDLDDHPALTRLVHWAGLLGTRVLLSSATLPPPQIQGLFEAYLAGRAAFQRNRGIPGQPVNVCCAWFDEYAQPRTSDHADADSFRQAHDQFVLKRIDQLGSVEDIRRKARIQPLDIQPGSPEQVRPALANHIHEWVHELHRHHHVPDPHSGKRVSFGLVRMANIDPLIDVAQALYRLGAKAGHRIHLCCYHAKHPLLVRSGIEERLDRLLKRENQAQIFKDDELRRLLDASAEPDQIFVILASPVAEVGRDHDYDWAIVEPSSMRSFIQLGGRVRRHRAGDCGPPNLYLLDTNLKHLEGKRLAYARPGFEGDDFPLHSHYLHDLLTPEQVAMMDARPRIRERDNPQPKDNLVDLEHERLRALMLEDDPQKRVLPVQLWWRTAAWLSGELQRGSPFRYDPIKHYRYVLLPNDDETEVLFHRIEDDGSLTQVSNLFDKTIPLDEGPRIGLWGAPDYLTALIDLADELGMELARCAQTFGYVDLEEVSGGRGWRYHLALGFRKDA